MWKKDIQKYALAKSYDNELYADRQYDLAVGHRDYSYARVRVWTTWCKNDFNPSFYQYT